MQPPRLWGVKGSRHCSCGKSIVYKFIKLARLQVWYVGDRSQVLREKSLLQVFYSHTRSLQYFRLHHAHTSTHSHTFFKNPQIQGTVGVMSDLCMACLSPGGSKDDLMVAALHSETQDEILTTTVFETMTWQLGLYDFNPSDCKCILHLTPWYCSVPSRVSAGSLRIHRGYAAIRKTEMDRSLEFLFTFVSLQD